MPGLFFWIANLIQYRECASFFGTYFHFKPNVIHFAMHPKTLFFRVFGWDQAERPDRMTK